MFNEFGIHHHHMISPVPSPSAVGIGEGCALGSGVDQNQAC
jgi:hypothetical protein